MADLYIGSTKITGGGGSYDDTEVRGLIDDVSTYAHDVSTVVATKAEDSDLQDVSTRLGGLFTYNSATQTLDINF